VASGTTNAPAAAAGLIGSAAMETTAARATLDEARFVALYSRLARPVASYLRRVLRDAAVADDLLQDTFCRLLGQPLPPMSDEELRRYVFRVATNLVTDHWRREGRRATEPADEATLPVEPPDHAGRADLARGFARLVPRDRALLWLAYVEGADHGEIADALGFRRPSVKVLLSRARRKLMQLVVGTEPEGKRT
jgi:RNA polymerase sigma-70 factor (ECF subfamily)